MAASVDYKENEDEKLVAKRTLLEKRP